MVDYKNFNYNDKEAVQKQLKEIEKAIMKYYGAIPMGYDEKGNMIIEKVTNKILDMSYIDSDDKVLTEKEKAELKNVSVLEKAIKINAKISESLGIDEKPREKKKIDEFAIKYL